MDKISLITIVVISFISNSESFYWGFNDFSWFNQPISWYFEEPILRVKTDNNKVFWRDPWNKVSNNTGHVFGAHLEKDFTMEICVEANFTTQYDQAGLMIYLDEEHWLKAGIEYIDGQPMIGSALTNGVSDAAVGLYTGNPQKFWLRLSKVYDIIVVKYSTDKSNWYLLRVAPFPVADSYFVGPICCSPTREGLVVKFSGLKIVEPAEDIFFSN